MYANKDILAKDELGNVWKFDNLSCTFGSETISYTMFKYIKWFGTELTLSQNGKTRIFYFDTATDAAHISEIIKSVSQNPEKYNRANNLVNISFIIYVLVAIILTICYKSKELIWVIWITWITLFCFSISSIYLI